MKNIIIKIRNPTYVSTSRSEVTKEGMSKLGRPKEIIQNSGQKIGQIEIKIQK